MYLQETIDASCCNVIATGDASVVEAETDADAGAGAALATTGATAPTPTRRDGCGKERSSANH